MGDFTDLVCIGRIFSQSSLQLEIFSPTYNGVRFFSALYVMSDIFFSAGYFSPRNLFTCFFPLEISLHDIFSKITHSPVKGQMVYQTFGQLTDADLSIISKSFWNNRGQNSLGERGGLRFYLPLPGEPVRSYLRTDGRWRHNQIFSDG